MPRIRSALPILPALILFFLTLLCLTLLPAPSLHGAPFPYDKLPPALAPWSDWVLAEQPDHSCTRVWGQNDQRQCQWPSRLSLTLNDQGGTFDLQGRLDKEDWQILPGDASYWPEQVTCNNQPTAVLRQGERPAVRLQAGPYRIRGAFSWSHQPEVLRIPPHTALVELTRNGRFVHQPTFEQDQLWLQPPQHSVVAEKQQVRFQVFRKLSDTIPATLVTHLELQVAGDPRELLTATLLPEGFVPLQVDSPLPARIEVDGRLRLQLEPGSWTIEVSARHLGPADQFSRPPVNGPWSAQEIWSVEAHNELRRIQISGAGAIDPAQSALPAGWKSLPAYLMSGTETLQLTSRSRGDEPPAADRLSLQRTLWLDFDGSGYTAEDHFSGTLSNAARLEAEPSLQLGRVQINGEDQFITRTSQSGASGFEVRQQQVDIQAESRIEPAHISQLPAVGWQLNPVSARTTLNLPPGWRLIDAMGADRVTPTWLRSWSLFDLFIVLVLCLSVSRLWGWRYGLLVLIALALTYHEPQAPRLSWLNALIPIALLRLLPAGLFRQLTQWYRNLALLILLVALLIFAVQQIRTAIYPQLDPLQSHRPFAPPRVAYQVDKADQVMARGKQVLREEISLSSMPLPLASKLERYDPDILTQTGPGVPRWHWRQVELQWNGPLQQGQQLKLLLLPPMLTRIFLFSGVLLCALLFLRLCQRDAPQRPTTPAPAASVAASLQLLLGLCGLLTPTPLQAADFPPPELLQQLQQRLTAPPDCAPHCAALQQLRVRINDQLLQLELEIHCASDSAVPLPFPLRQLHLTNAACEGRNTIELYRDGNDTLWLRATTGANHITLQAAIPEGIDRIQLPLPMPAGRVTVQASGWDSHGLSNGQGQSNPIELRRQHPATSQRLQPGTMPVFVEVTRQLQLGFDWQVSTRVRRLSQSGQAAVLRIPLLSGEQVTSPGFTLDQGDVVVALPPERDSISWQSSLDKTSQLELLASTDPSRREIWQLQASPLWHVRSEGLPLIRRYQQGRWLPEWQPWGQERLVLTIEKPQGVAGQSVTIDDSKLVHQLGERRSETKLTCTLRSSHGCDHPLTLPEGAQLTALRINGQPQPLHQDGRSLTLPLQPGRQTVELTWQQPQPPALYTSTPLVDLGSASVNNEISLELPQNRWILLTGGPQLGPAVLFWGVLLVLVGVAAVLGRYAPTPLRGWHWLLLGAGLSQASLPALLPVVLWLVLLGYRQQQPPQRPGLFNLGQIVLVLLTLAALATLISAIQQGLLGLPEMQIAGNHSSAWHLNWYQDRSSGPLAQGWAITVPMLVYRVLMLLWALWLAMALLRWLQWGWSCFSHSGLWRSLPRRPRKTRATTPPETPATPEVPAEPAAQPQTKE
ncbi:MAG: hypothetical protein JXR59_08705 [Desulfuromonadaceae bacterium]|nr:hypothetical protein [Desulfuromonadaceae bacterium]